MCCHGSTVAVCSYFFFSFFVPSPSPALFPECVFVCVWRRGGVSSSRDLLINLCCIIPVSSPLRCQIVPSNYMSALVIAFAKWFLLLRFSCTYTPVFFYPDWASSHARPPPHLVCRTSSTTLFCFLRSLHSVPNKPRMPVPLTPRPLSQNKYI